MPELPEVEVVRVGLEPAVTGATVTSAEVFDARSLRVWRANQAAVRDWRPSPYTGPLDVFGQPPITALPATVVQRAHECGADGQLPDALRELLG